MRRFRYRVAANLAASIALIAAGCGGAGRPAGPSGPDDPDGPDDPNPPSGMVRLEIEVLGQGTVEPGSADFAPGTVVELVARAEEGWRFDRWEGDLTAGAYDHWRDPALQPASATSVSLSENIRATAVFVERQTGAESVDLGGGVTLDLVEVAGGTFIQGSSAEEQARFTLPGVDLSDEGPQREVTVSTFALGRTEVTQAQFAALMGFVPTVPEDCTQDCGNGALSDDRPVGWTTWLEADEFCTRLSEIAGRSCRLPTEAEWEHACRAGSESAFSFGDDPAGLDGEAWFAGNSGWPNEDDSAHPVAQKSANAFGLFDLHGNVWEWVGDWYGAYLSSAEQDPTGPGPDRLIRRKILRGGAYSRAPWALRSAYRYDPGGPDGRQFNFGFRVVCE